MPELTLDIVTQEGPVFSGRAQAVTAPASLGQVTILPGHIPLFTKLNPGELKVLVQGRWQIMATAGGFMDVAPKNHLTILADSAVRVEEINLAKAEAAKKAAEDDLRKGLPEHEYVQVTAQLRRATIEIQTARKYHRRSEIPRE